MSVTKLVSDNEIYDSSIKGAIEFHSVANDAGAGPYYKTVIDGGAVYPAAGLVNMARGADAHTVELNLEPSDGAHYFAEHHYGPASEVVPGYVRKLLGEG